MGFKLTGTDKVSHVINIHKVRVCKLVIDKGQASRHQITTCQIQRMNENIFDASRQNDSPASNLCKKAAPAEVAILPLTVTKNAVGSLSSCFCFQYLNDTCGGWSSKRKMSQGNTSILINPSNHSMKHTLHTFRKDNVSRSVSRFKFIHPPLSVYISDVVGIEYIYLVSESTTIEV